MFRCLMPLIGLASVGAVIAAGPSLGQTNIDQGKPASELFANYCAVCHKSTRGLANGRSSFTLSLFLGEHYAASREQAAALAAYVISAGGNAPAAKPERAKSEQPKPQEAKGQERGQEKGQEKGQESKGQEAKGHETKSGSASAKSEPEKPALMGEPGHEEAPTEQEPASVVAAPVATAPVATAPVVVAPAASPSPSSGEAPELRPTTNAGIESQSNDEAPVPRDNIPD